MSDLSCIDVSTCVVPQLSELMQCNESKKTLLDIHEWPPMAISDITWQNKVLCTLVLRKRDVSCVVLIQKAQFWNSLKLRVFFSIDMVPQVENSTPGFMGWDIIKTQLHKKNRVYTLSDTVYKVNIKQRFYSQDISLDICKYSEMQEMSEM